MAVTQIITTSDVVAGASSLLQGAFKSLEGEYLTVADIDSIALDVFLLDDEERTQVDSTDTETTDHYSEPDAEDVIYDELQDWALDNNGYNLAYAFTPFSRSRYEVRIVVTSTGGTKYGHIWQLNAF